MVVLHWDLRDSVTNSPGIRIFALKLHCVFSELLNVWLLHWKSYDDIMDIIVQIHMAFVAACSSTVGFSSRFLFFRSTMQDL